MKKASRSAKSAETRDEYDFSGGVSGKYASRVAQEVKMVVLEPDVARAFKSPAAVNRALRVYLADEAAKKRRSGVR